MHQTINRALAPGTIKNRQAQAKLYIKFMLIYSFDYLHPSTTALAMYTQFLANTYPAPGTAKNHLSGIKSWIILHGGRPDNFATLELSLMSKAITEKSQHVPNPAAALTARDIQTICHYIDCNQPQHPGIKAAILMAFATFLRVSNVLSPSTSTWGGRHTLRAQDVLKTADGMKIIIRSTKTRRTGRPHVLHILRTADVRFCPVTAWEAYYELVVPCPLGPAFMVDASVPLTAGPVVSVMRKALNHSKITSSSNISFHSLRRGGAQSAAAQGATQEQIMEHRTWKSKTGVDAYLRPNPRIVPALLADTLASN